ncbi:MAG: hypothetical protein IT547_04130 [Hyphomonadaceae bacterium]|nr:hypothetical protein [Hyphomonadaceae bacterium]
MELEAAAYVANVAMALVAIVGVAFAVWQTREFRNHQLETLARDQYQRFLELCIEHPEFAQPPNDQLDCNARTIDGSAIAFVQYEWFVSAGVNALEAIYLAVGHQPGWRETIKSVLEDHAPFLMSRRYDETIRFTGDARFQTFLDSWVPARLSQMQAKQKPTGYQEQATSA